MATAARVRLLDELAEIGTRMARQTAQQAEKCNWVDAKDTYMFDTISRSVRRSVALAEKIEAAARRRAAGDSDDKAAPARGDRPRAARDAAGTGGDNAGGDNAGGDGAGGDGAGGDGAGGNDADGDGPEREPADGPRESEPLFDRPERLDDEPETEDELGDLPAGVIVAGICRDLGVTRDLSGFTDAEMGFDRARWEKAAAGPQPKPPPLPEGWIEGENGRVQISGPPATLWPYPKSPPARSEGMGREGAGRERTGSDPP